MGSTLTAEQLAQIQKALADLNDRIERVAGMIDELFEERDALRAELRLVKGGDHA